MNELRKTDLTFQKPGHIPDQRWKEHLRWRAIVDEECRSNQLRQCIPTHERTSSIKSQ